MPAGQLEQCPHRFGTHLHNAMSECSHNTCHQQSRWGKKESSPACRCFPKDKNVLVSSHNNSPVAHIYNLYSDFGMSKPNMEEVQVSSLPEAFSTDTVMSNSVSPFFV